MGMRLGNGDTASVMADYEADLLAIPGGDTERGAGVTATFVDSTWATDQEGILTLELRYPRSIHAEFMTHRNLSRNAASSRAVPFKTTVENLVREGGTFYPMMYWTRDQKGMQAAVDAIDTAEGDAAVERMRDFVIRECEELNRLGVHKSILNRYLEPFSYITVVATGSFSWWADLKWQRLHKDAERHFQVLAADIKRELRLAKINTVTSPGCEGHFPYLETGELAGSGVEVGGVVNACRVSAARCGRISYNINGMTGKAFTWEDDLALGLKMETPTLPLVDWRWHASPPEHVVLGHKCALDLRVVTREDLAFIIQNTKSIYGELPVVTYRQIIEAKLLKEGVLAPKRV